MMYNFSTKGEICQMNNGQKKVPTFVETQNEFLQSFFKPKLTRLYN